MPDIKHVSLKPLLDKISEIANLIQINGWAEAKAGNLSIRITDIIQKNYHTDEEWYLVSRTGSRYRSMVTEPTEALMLISGSGAFFPASVFPTSEWISHLALQTARPEYEVVLHTHPAEIIAISHLIKDEARLNSVLAGVLPELPLYLPEGIALAKPCPPGSQELSDASIAAIDQHKALIWSGHGLLTFGKTMDEAMDYMEIVSKAAKIYLMIKTTRED